MARNFDRYESLRQRIERWELDRRYSGLRDLRRRLYRSRDGKVLGVFRGIAESMGFCVFWTRVIGGIILATLADFFGAHGVMVTLLVGGFFYLLAALLMQAPRGPGDVPIPASGPSGASEPPPLSRTRYAGSAPYQDLRPRPRVDLAQLDRQLDSLNHRIQRMETIVTDRQYDWERRLES